MITTKLKKKLNYEDGEITQRASWDSWVCGNRTTKLPVNRSFELLYRNAIPRAHKTVLFILFIFFYIFPSFSGPFSHLLAHSYREGLRRHRKSDGAYCIKIRDSEIFLNLKMECDGTF